MRRPLYFVILLLVISAMLAACDSGEPEATIESSTHEPNYTAEKESPIQIVILPTMAPEQELSKTTGLPFGGEYKPVIVVIENSSAARPQTGLQTADVVYEVPVEGSITRFVCVFSDNVPSEVMPVRSARVPFLYIQHEWDAAFMHYGGSGASAKSKPYSVYGHKLFSEINFDIDGLKGKWSKYYHRVSGIGAPHNVMGNPQLVQELYDYTPEPLHWIFYSNFLYSGEDVSEINLKMCSGDDNFITYTYDEVSDMYMRSMNGKIFTSAETGAQVGVKNLIIQFSTYKMSAGIKLWSMVGSGDADYYIGGKMIHGTWKRETVDDETVYYDDNGYHIVLRPGNTWIHISPEN